MPMRIYVSGEKINIYPKTGPTTIKLDSEDEIITVDPGYYVATLNITGK
jgi:hypothetical protein